MTTTTCDRCDEPETHRWVISVDGEGDFAIPYTGEDFDEAREAAEAQICGGDYYADNPDGFEIGFRIRCDDDDLGWYVCAVPARDDNPHYRG